MTALDALLQSAVDATRGLGPVTLQHAEHSGPRAWRCVSGRWDGHGASPSDAVRALLATVEADAARRVQSARDGGDTRTMRLWMARWCDARGDYARAEQWRGVGLNNLPPQAMPGDP